MGRNPAHLNQKQIDVLRWIKDGCPDGVYEHGYEHRIIARALENRGLVTIYGRGRAWHAAITPAGLARESAGFTDAPPPESDADLLIDRVLDAGGTLRLPEDRDIEATHERLVTMSLKSARRPHGKKLEIRRTGQWGAGPKEIVLVEHFDDYVEAMPVPVPARVTRYHPAVRAFLENTDWQYVSKQHLARAARILQAIAAEAPHRGIEVLSTERAGRAGHPHVEPTRRCHLYLKTAVGGYEVHVREMPGTGANKVARRRWNERKTQPSWIENRGWEFISTGKLEVAVDGPGTTYQGDHYRDARSKAVEDKLPDLFRSFEIYRLRAEWADEQRQRAEADRQQRREQALTQAKLAYTRQMRWEHFTRISRDWQAIRGHREFVTAAKAAIETLDINRRSELLAEIDIVEHILQDLDATRHPAMLLPAISNPTIEDLAPYVDNRSLLGPNNGRW